MEMKNNFKGEMELSRYEKKYYLESFKILLK